MTMQFSSECSMPRRKREIKLIVGGKRWFGQQLQKHWNSLEARKVGKRLQQNVRIILVM